MKFINTFIFSLLSFILFSCSSAQINNDYDQSFDFTKLITYKITKEVPKMPNGSTMPSATFGLIKSAIDLEMATKGIGKNNELADFGITWHTALNDNVYENINSLKNWELSFKKNEEGMLIIDIVNLTNNEVVWRGWKKDVINSDNLEEQINNAVSEILSQFPPEHPLGLGK